jgi:hypothetical protein
MNNKILIWTVLIAFSIFHAPSLVRADNPGVTVTETQTAPQDAQVEPIAPAQETSSSAAETEPTIVETDIEDDETPQGTPVSPSDNSAEKTKNKEFWRNIILAATAVVVAVVSILVVSNNNGKKG